MTARSLVRGVLPVLLQQQIVECQILYSFVGFAHELSHSLVVLPRFKAGEVSPPAATSLAMGAKSDALQLAALMALFAAGLQYMRCTCNAARHWMRCNAAPR